MNPNPIYEVLPKHPSDSTKKVDAETLKKIHNSQQDNLEILKTLEKIDPAYHQKNISPKHPSKGGESLEVESLKEEILKIRQEKMELLIHTIRREISEEALRNQEIRYDQERGILTIFEYDISRGNPALNLPANKIPQTETLPAKGESFKAFVPHNSLNDPLENLTNHLPPLPSINNKEDPKQNLSLQEEAQRITRDDHYITEKYPRLELGYYYETVPAPPKFEEVYLDDTVQLKEIPQTTREFRSRTERFIPSEAETLVMNKILEIIKRLNRKT
jgi:hypothetical protein